MLEGVRESLLLRVEVLPAPPGSAASKRVTAIRAADPFEEVPRVVNVVKSVVHPRCRLCISIRLCTVL